jgi:hypothetical protein
LDRLDALLALPAQLAEVLDRLAATDRRLEEIAPSDGDAFLSLKTPAELSDLSLGMIQKSAASGDLPSVKRGTRRLVQRRQLLGWMTGGGSKPVRGRG